jgi:Polyketide cyclase / dehydrase and lipid transport
MPSFALSTRTDAPLEEVWKLLHDPSRYPEWWEGIETVRPEQANGVGADYTVWPEGCPDVPIAQRMDLTPAGVTVSCLVSDLVYRWQLAEAGAGTSIAVDVEIPEHEAHRLTDQQRLVRASLERLATLALTA